MSSSLTSLNQPNTSSLVWWLWYWGENQSKETVDTPWYFGKFLIGGFNLVATTVVGYFTQLVDGLGVLVAFITLDIEPLNALGDWANLIKIPIWSVFILAIVRLLPFT